VINFGFSLEARDNVVGCIFHPVNEEINPYVFYFLQSRTRIHP